VISPRLVANTVVLLLAIGIIAFFFFFDGGLQVGNSERRRDPEREEATGRGYLLAIALGVIVMIAAILFGIPWAAHGRDGGRFASADPEIKAWFDKLASKRGPCCSDADGTALSDVDWEAHDGRYRVRIDEQWIDVPDDAVLTVPNRVGRTMVWPIRISGLPVSIRCFMPGAMG
jgi:hypothetical protein